MCSHNISTNRCSSQWLTQRMSPQCHKSSVAFHFTTHEDSEVTAAWTIFRKVLWSGIAPTTKSYHAACLQFKPYLYGMIKTSKEQRELGEIQASYPPGLCLERRSTRALGQG